MPELKRRISALTPLASLIMAGASLIVAGITAVYSHEQVRASYESLLYQQQLQFMVDTVLNIKELSHAVNDETDLKDSVARQAQVATAAGKLKVNSEVAGLTLGPVLTGKLQYVGAAASKIMEDLASVAQGKLPQAKVDNIKDETNLLFKCYDAILGCARSVLTRGHVLSEETEKTCVSLLTNARNVC